MLRTTCLPLLSAVALLVSCSVQAQPVSLLAPGAPKPIRTKQYTDPLPAGSTGPGRSKRTNSTGFQVGLRGGANYFLYIKNKPTETISQGWLGHGGLVLNTGGRVVSFQPEFTYNRTTTKFSDDDETVKVTTGQLVVPLLAKISFSNPEATRFFVVLGPYASYLLNFRITDTSAGQTTTTNPNLGAFKDRFSYGGTAGLGVSIPAGPGRFTLEARGLLGLGSLDEFTTADGITLQGSVGYLFSLGSR